MTSVSKQLADIIIASSSAIRDAMAAIEQNGREMVLVEGEAGKIAGLITDGDIRRGLLAGLTLQSNVSQIMMCDFASVPPEFDRASVLDLMRARSFQHVPVLDEDGRLLACHFLRDLIGASPKPNIAVIMAGGKGTRLRPFTENIPKPMVEIAGRPMLERIVLHLVGHGVQQIYLAVNYLAEVIEDHFGDGSAFGCSIGYLRETRPLGTGGPLSLLPTRPSCPFFVLNADQIMRTDLTAMLNQHLASNCEATVAVGPHQIELPYAVVTERDGLLTGLEEKPTFNFLVNRGIYVLNPDVLDHIPADQEFPITNVFETLIALKRPIGAFKYMDYWLDVGAPTDLLRAHGRG